MTSQPSNQIEYGPLTKPGCGSNTAVQQQSARLRKRNRRRAGHPPHCGGRPRGAVTYINPDDIYSTFHFISASIFLFCLAMMSLFRFPKDDSSNEKPNKRDKFLYRLCGVAMLLAMLVIFMGNYGILINEKYFEYPYSGTFWGEAVAVWFFGYSWLLKAGFFTKVRLLFR